MRSIDLLLFEYSSPFFAVIGADDGLLVFIFFLSVVFIRSSRCSVRYLFVRAAAPKRKKSAVKRLVHTYKCLTFFGTYLFMSSAFGKEKKKKTASAR
jgi:hypothetical protein